MLIIYIMSNKKCEQKPARGELELNSRPAQRTTQPNLATVAMKLQLTAIQTPTANLLPILLPHAQRVTNIAVRSARTDKTPVAVVAI